MLKLIIYGIVLLIIFFFSIGLKVTTKPFTLKVETPWYGVLFVLFLLVSVVWNIIHIKSEKEEYIKGYELGLIDGSELMLDSLLKPGNPASIKYKDLNKARKEELKKE